MGQKSWKLDFSNPAKKQLHKLDTSIQKKILSFLYHRLSNNPDPRLFGKVLRGNLLGYWSYRVGDYRIIADIQDHKLTILIIDIGHRREIYN